MFRHKKIFIFSYSCKTRTMHPFLQILSICLSSRPPISQIPSGPRINTFKWKMKRLERKTSEIMRCCGLDPTTYSLNTHFKLQNIYEKSNRRNAQKITIKHRKPAKISKEISKNGAISFNLRNFAHFPVSSTSKTPI